MLTKEEMQKPRTPKKLEQYFWDVYNATTPEERRVGRLKNGLWRNFFNEFSVLRIYSTWKFPDNDVTVEYIIGNQGYDAVIQGTSSGYAEYVEITFPVIGEEEKKEAISINELGFAKARYNRYELMKRFIETAEKKSLKDYNYTNSSLIFAVDVFPLSYFKNKDNYEVISPFIEQLLKFKFKVKSVYLVLFNTDQSSVDRKVFVVSED